MSEQKEEKQSRLPVVRALIVVVGLVLVAIMLIDWNGLVWNTSSRSTDDAQLRGQPSALESRVPGLVVWEADIDNAPVRRGQLLFRIEDDYARAAVARARAAVQVADAGIARAEAERAAQQAQIGAALAQQAVSEAQLAYAKEDAARWNRLAGTPGGLLRARQQADTNLQAARDRSEGDRNGVEQARLRLGAMDATVQQAQAQAGAARETLRLAAIRLDWTRIVAPADGRVTERVVHVGQWVSPGRRMISFVPLPDTWAVAWYREEQVAGMRIGQPVDIHVDAYPELGLHGCIAGFGPTSQSWSEVVPPNRATGNFTKVVQRIPVRITYVTPTDAVPLLVPGLSVETLVHIDGPGCTPPAEGR
ncbi:HlyD family secretion protein [Lichenicoccus roseus]|uniref:HlyD family secretion protein n=1 Tax=Lichenicoccus roseus TaxID=2683649 RepID=A0A5R9J3T7_9PROT|nr:HlyD family secretion protein [Lichenicoccus roseus]TLU72295.1 HlyD family secretion protein [Lichenicoccus roseus]